MIKSSEKGSIKDEIIEEIDDTGKHYTFRTSELINIINKNFVCNQNFGGMDNLDYENFGKNYSIPKIICEKTKVKNFVVYKDIYYNNNKLLATPLIIDFVNKDGLSIGIYRIYDTTKINMIIKSNDFKNPVIVDGKKICSFSSLSDVVGEFLREFKIEDQIVIDYNSIFLKKDEQNNLRNLDFKKGLDLTENFKYYFDYPDPEEEFFFIPSNDRTRILSNEFKKKIIGFCGPMGIGKSTTLLTLLKLKSNYCYINIKALKEHEDDVLIWKEQLLLKEIAYALKNSYKFEIFNNLKKKIDNISSFWEAIKETINYFIQKEIKINFIFDQYKCKFDPDYKYIKEIKAILEKDEKNILSIIISSSINDKDVRYSLLSKLLKEDPNLVIEYIYLKSLIDIGEYIKNDSKLSKIQREMIINDFNSIPKFYYSIKSIKDEKKLNEYKLTQIQKISKSINDFFSEPENFLDREKIETLISLRGFFGQNLEKNDFLKLLKILPFKYFTFDLTNNIVDFSFPLVKDIFDDFLANKLCDFLKSPISSLKQGTIGDILELNLTSDLSKQLFCKIDQTILVDSIWYCKNVKSAISGESKSILFLQELEEAKFIDFAILNDRKDLLLYQCKKALKELPKDFITKKKVEDYRFNLYKIFHTNFNIELENIYLYYITGITFFMKDNIKQYRTWGVKDDENFDKLKKLAASAEADLFYYDVLNKKIYIENKNNFEIINNLIEYAKKNSSPIVINLKENTLNIGDVEYNRIESEYFSQANKSLEKLNRDIKDEFFTVSQKAYLKKNNGEILNNEIVYCIKEPNVEDYILCKRMIGLKRGNKQYLLIDKFNKVKDDPEKKSKKKKIKKRDEFEKQNSGEEEEEDEKIGKNNTKKSLVLVGDNGLEELKKIELDFYNNIDFAFIFKNNIILSDI